MFPTEVLLLSALCLVTFFTLSPSQICFRFTPSFFTDPHLSLWAEAVPGWCYVSRPPWVPSTPADLLTVPSSPNTRLVFQRSPAGRIDQLLYPHRLLLCQLLLHVSGAPRRVGPVSCTVRRAQAEVGADCGADNGGNKGGGDGSQSHGEAGEAHRTQCVSQEGTGNRWCQTHPHIPDTWTQVD